MRILFLDSSQIWEHTLPKGFVDIGHKVMISGPLTENNLPNMIETFKPDLIISIGWGIENLPSKQKWIAKYVHQYKIPLVYWAIEDSAYMHEWSLPLIETINPNIVFTISNSSLTYYNQHGIIAELLDFGYHSSVHHPTDIISDYNKSISIVANAYPDIYIKYPNHYRLTSMKNLISPLLENNIRIDFWGKDWDKMKPYLGVDIPSEWIHGYTPYKDTSKIYSSSSIVLALQNYEEHVTQRVYEILASGGFILTNHTPGINNIFKPNHDLVTTSSPKETIELVNYYLNNPSKRQEISKNGLSSVSSHSYCERASTLLKYIVKHGIVNETLTESTEQGEIYYYENYTEDKYVLYMVSPGDTLWGISRKFQVPLDTLMELNNLSSSEILVDQVLKIYEKIDSESFSPSCENNLNIEKLSKNPITFRWLNNILDSSTKHSIPPSILYSIMVAESRGNPNLVSTTGGIGLMQIHIETANWLDINPCKPIDSIDGAAKYLKDLYNEFLDWNLAIAAYNAGPDMVRKYSGIPPLDEPQNYVKNVLSMSQSITLS